MRIYIHIYIYIPVVGFTYAGYLHAVCLTGQGEIHGYIHVARRE